MRLRMSGLLVMLGVFLAVSACDEAPKTSAGGSASGDKSEAKDKKSGDDTKTTSTNPAAAKMAGFADAICACKDAACAKGAHTTYATWVASFSAADAKMEKADFDAWKSAQARLLGCWKKHSTAVAVALDMSKPADVIKRMGGFIDKMCACKTAACATSVDDEAKTAMKDVKLDVIKQIRTDSELLFKRFKDCRDKAKASDPDGNDESVKLVKFADDMCACKDNTCADAVQKKMMAWIKKHFMGGKKKGTKKNVEKWKTAQKRYAACYVEKMKAGLTKPPGAQGGDDFGARIEQYATDMCACTTAACAAQVAQKHGQWIAEAAKTMYSGPNGTANARKMQEVTKRVMACMKRTMGRR